MGLSRGSVLVGGVECGECECECECEREVVCSRNLLGGFGLADFLAMSRHFVEHSGLRTFRCFSEFIHLSDVVIILFSKGSRQICVW